MKSINELTIFDRMINYYHFAVGQYLFVIDIKKDSCDFLGSQLSFTLYNLYEIQA